MEPAVLASSARMSSSPLRGVATPCSGGRVARGVHVLIAPTRGRNKVTPGATRTDPRPHRPYEGSQHVGDCPLRPCRVVSSSPLRGVATRRARPSVDDCHARPHRPYEGSQLGVPRAVRRRRGVRSSSPLRGVATRARRRRPAVLRPGSSSPLRGVATSTLTLRAAVCMTRPHRPYEGSQHPYWEVDEAAATWVLIAPTRGRNTAVPNPRRDRMVVLIAPTRGHNGSSSASGGQYHIVLMALRWVATESQLASISLPDR